MTPNKSSQQPLIKLLVTIILFLLILSTSITFAFPDIQGHWAEQFIRNVQSKGMIAGYPDGTFRPERYMSRAEFITLSVTTAKTLGYPIGEFSSSNYWAGKYIAKAKEIGLIVEQEYGAEDADTYDQKITRAEFASILCNLGTLFTLPKDSTKQRPTDIDNVPQPYQDRIVESIQMTLISGKGNNLFDPAAPAKRAEVATVINKLSSIVEQENGEVPSLRIIGQSIQNYPNAYQIIPGMFNGSWHLYHKNSPSFYALAVNQEGTIIAGINAPASTYNELKKIDDNPSFISFANADVYETESSYVIVPKDKNDQQAVIFTYEITKQQNDTFMSLVALDQESYHVNPASNNEKLFFELLNSFRVRHQLPALSYRENIATISRNYSTYMSERGFFGHTDPDGKTFQQRISESSIPNHLAAENIAFGISDPLLALCGFINSPGHRRNILLKSINETGVGYHYDNGRAMITNIFIEK